MVHHSVQLEKESLRPLVRELPRYLTFCRENNTIKTYMTAFRKWESWAKNLGVVALPANSTSFSIFILSRIQLDERYSSVRAVYYAVKFIHTFGGLADPTDHLLVKNIFEAAHRLCKNDINKKEPLEVSHIALLYSYLVEKNSSLTNLRTAVIILVGFAGFLRFEEVINIRRSDVVFMREYMKIFLEKSKTDIYREGRWVLISSTDTKYCPVKNLALYFHRTGIQDIDSNEFIFRGITHFKKQKIDRLRVANKPISYSRTRECFLQAVVKVGLPRKIFGLHSLRAGGATAAANAGIPDRLFKRHGRWRSETAKDGYVKDNVDSLLLVSQSLGL